MRTTSPKPPAVPTWLLRFVLHDVDADTVLGDLEETYVHLCGSYSVREARRWYWSQVLRSVPAFFIRSFYWMTLMIRHYAKISLRTMRKQAGYTAVNVFGLAVAIAICLLIFLFIRDEFTFDRFHTERDRIFQVERAYYHPDGSLRYQSVNGPGVLRAAMLEELPEVAHAVRVTYGEQDYFVRVGETATEERILFTDADAFEVFTFPFKQGNPATALQQPDGIVLTEALAKKHFGDEDPFGQTVQLHLGGEYQDFTVTGVMYDIPSNSTLQFAAAVEVNRAIEVGPILREIWDSWSLSYFRTFVLLDENAQEATAEAKLPAFTEKYRGNELTTLRERYDWGSDGLPMSYVYEPLTALHFSNYSTPTYSYILGGIALAILLIACINFMTLAIGRSASRGREIGVRKVVGAQRRQLMGQFWGEAMLMSAVALILGMTLAYLLLPAFNGLADKNLSFAAGNPWGLVLVLAGLMFGTGLIAGSYPAVVLSAFRPVETLKNKLRLSGSNMFTKTLIVVQFALTVFLVASTLVMVQQLNFIRTTDLGFNTDQVVVLPTQGQDGLEIAQRMRQQLQTDPRIVDVVATGILPGYRGSTGVGFEHEGVSYNINLFSVETNYLDFFDLELAAGRNFDPNLTTDTSNVILVNETLLETFGIDDPLGKEIPGFGFMDPPPIIAGVVKDFTYQALYQEQQPMLMTLESFWGFEYVFVRIAPTDIPGSMAAIEAAWGDAAPTVPWKYSFLDDEMQRVYEADQRWARIVRYAAFIAIVIACLGLLGLAALTVAARTKEIGIRKVLGASASRVVLLISKDFLWLVGIGVVIATPVAYYVMAGWLENFEFRIMLGPWLFVGAGLLAIAVAFVTVSYQSLKAAHADPVKSLRYE